MSKIKIQQVRDRFNKGLVPHGKRAVIKQFLDNVDKLEASPELQSKNREKLRKLVDTALNGSREEAKVANEELGRIRSQTVGVYISGSANANTFFENIELEDDERPIIREGTGRIEVGVHTVSKDGVADYTQLGKDLPTFEVKLEMLSTDIVEFELMDLNSGEMAMEFKENLDMAFDLERKEDGMLWPLLDSAVGTLDFNTIDVHSSINKANLPSTNLLEPSTKGASSKWTLECWKEVYRYLTGWENAMRDGELYVTDIFIPTPDKIDGMFEMLSEADNNLHDQLLAMFGDRRPNIIAEPTLDPAAGRAYVRTNKPVGYTYEKPSIGGFREEGGEKLENFVANKGKMVMTRAIGSAIPTTMKMNFAAVQYRNAA